MPKQSKRLSEALAPYLAGEGGNVTKLSISLPTSLIDEVRAAARERGTSVSATIAAAVRRALDEGEATGPTPAPKGTELTGVAELARFRGQSVGGIVDEALSEYLAARGIRLSPVRDDEWRRRIESTLEERRGRAEQGGWTDEQVATDVDAAVKEAREARTARRR